MNLTIIIILYGVTLLCISGAMPYRSNETYLLSQHDMNSAYFKKLLRQAKAAEISSFLNTSVDPCDDFYEFSCGNWQRINKASSQIVTTGQFERLADGLNRKLKSMLNKADQDTVPAIDKLVKNYYKSCMNIKEIDKSVRHAKYKSKEEECTAETKRQLPRILDNLAFRNFNNNSTSKDIKTIWNELKTAFRDQLLTDNSLNWMSNQTRTSAIAKLDAMRLKINSYDLEKLTAEYSSLNITDDDFFLNQRRIKEHSALQNRDQLNKAVRPLYDGELLSSSPVNILEENAIKIPVAFLQPYFMLEASYPSATKFGSLGSLIGHELIHGFDSNGQGYDAEGNFKSWWDEHSMANFEERKKCFKQQYSKYFYNGKQLPESNDQGENIADNGGLRLAYAAYRRWLYAQLMSGKAIRKLENERLPSLDYSIMQLFFISYTQVGCNDIAPDTRKMLDGMDEHTPGKFRVIGSLSNSEEFAEVFKCNEGSRMNPVKKCIIY